MSFAASLKDIAADIDRLLGQVLDPGAAAAPRVVEAMRYAALGQGKRLRPFFLVESAKLLGARRDHALRAGAALECVHCYSLVHDDLPAMDDDDLRRGRPTCHKAFDEATAILAGDGLLTLAFEITSDPATHPEPRSGPNWCWSWRAPPATPAWWAGRCSTWRPKPADCTTSTPSCGCRA
jgi:farnesyl diphosphate synthase